MPPHTLTEYEIDEMPAEQLAKAVKDAIPDASIEGMWGYLKMMEWHVRLETDGEMVYENPAARPTLCSIQATEGAAYWESKGKTLTEVLQKSVLKSELPITDDRGQWR